METSTREDVAKQLEDAVARTGVPRAIVDDHDVDLNGGVQIFQQNHPDTVEIYDVKHKAACLLKSRLEKNPRWMAFCTRVGQTRCAIQQTELGALTPPSPKPKARFMNLEDQLNWADKILALLDGLPGSALSWVTPQRLEEKLGWVREFSDDLSQWRQWQAILNMTVRFVGSEGLHGKTALMLSRKLRPLLRTAEGRRLAAELVRFLRGEASKAKPGERLPGSTEVLESCFGRFKALEKDQSKGGFTSLLLGFGALFAEATKEGVLGAMRAVPTKQIERLVRRAYRADLILPAKGGVRPGTDCATKTGRSNPVIRGTFSSGQDRAPWRHDPTRRPGDQDRRGAARCRSVFSFGIGTKAANRPIEVRRSLYLIFETRFLHFTVNHYEPNRCRRASMAAASRRILAHARCPLGTAASGTDIFGFLVLLPLPTHREQALTSQRSRMALTAARKVGSSRHCFLPRPTGGVTARTACSARCKRASRSFCFRCVSAGERSSCTRSFQAIGLPATLARNTRVNSQPCPRNSWSSQSSCVLACPDSELVQPASELFLGVAGHGQGHQVVIAFRDQFGAGGQSRHLAIADVEQAGAPQQGADTTGHRQIQGIIGRLPRIKI